MWQRWAQRGLLGLSLLLGCVLIYLLMTNSTASPPPTATAPGTIMPPYKLPQKDLETLTTYLMALPEAQ